MKVAVVIVTNKKLEDKLVTGLIKYGFETLTVLPKPKHVLDVITQLSRRKLGEFHLVTEDTQTAIIEYTKDAALVNGIVIQVTTINVNELSKMNQIDYKIL